MRLLNCAPMKTPNFMQDFCHISYMSGIIINFMLKFPNVHYHGNKGYSLVNLNDATKLCDLENSLLGGTCFAISVLSTDL